jgi:hypothetical protein
MFVIEIIFEADVIVALSRQTALFHWYAFKSVVGMAVTNIFIFIWLKMESFVRQNITHKQ